MQLPNPLSAEELERGRMLHRAVLTAFMHYDKDRAVAEWTDWKDRNAVALLVTVSNLERLLTEIDHHLVYIDKGMEATEEAGRMIAVRRVALRVARDKIHAALEPPHITEAVTTSKRDSP